MTAGQAGVPAGAPHAPAEVSPMAAPAAEPDCMACGHSGGQHDRIARRFCDATVERALTRGCVCSAAPVR